MCEYTLIKGITHFGLVVVLMLAAYNLLVFIFVVKLIIIILYFALQVGSYAIDIIIHYLCMYLYTVERLSKNISDIIYIYCMAGNFRLY